jgi:hypothetical protein
MGCEACPAPPWPPRLTSPHLVQEAGGRSGPGALMMFSCNGRGPSVLQPALRSSSIGGADVHRSRARNEAELADEVCNEPQT